MRSTLFLMALLITLQDLTLADHLELKRAAHLKSEPNANSETVAQITPPARLRIIDSAQTNGYYHVETLDSQETGWVYRTLGRRFPGEASDEVTSGTDATRNAVFAGRVAAARRRSSQACSADLSSCPEDGCASPEDEPEHALLNRLKKNRNPTGPLVPLTFKQFRALQRETNRLRLPVGRGTELSAEEREQLRRIKLSDGLVVGERGLVQLVGYIAPERDLKASGGESVNCRLKNAASNDIHIPIVQRPDDSEYQSIVVEPIPQARPTAWSVSTFKKLQEEGRLLMIRGQLLFDNQHQVHDDPDDEEGLKTEPKRFTTWEIHPIMTLFECNRPSNGCTASDATQWKEIK